MRFWDASAIIPLCVNEPRSERLTALAKQNPAIVVWWGTVVECQSAFARLRREDIMARVDENAARHVLTVLATGWIELLPSERIREQASHALRLHPLRAADSMQLAAALVWSDGRPHGLGFVCLDQRLAEAAQTEGFDVLA